MLGKGTYGLPLGKPEEDVLIVRNACVLVCNNQGMHCGRLNIIGWMEGDGGSLWVCLCPSQSRVLPLQCKVLLRLV